MTIENSFILLDNNVVIVYSHRSMIVRNRKGENHLVKLFLALYRFEELDDPFHNNNHIVRILSIDNVQCCDVTLHLVR
jgi:hypothetical protein